MDIVCFLFLSDKTELSSIFSDEKQTGKVLLFLSRTSYINIKSELQIV